MLGSLGARRPSSLLLTAPKPFAQGTHSRKEVICVEHEMSDQEDVLKPGPQRMRKGYSTDQGTEFLGYKL